MKAPKIREGEIAHVYMSLNEGGISGSIDNRFIKNPSLQEYFVKKVFPVLNQITYYYGLREGTLRGMVYGVVKTHEELEKKSKRKSKKK